MGRRRGLCRGHAAMPLKSSLYPKPRVCRLCGARGFGPVRRRPICYNKYMTENDFYQNYEVPQDLRFYTQDILRGGGLNCSAKLAPKYFDSIFTAPNKITQAHVELEFWPAGKEIMARGRVYGKRQVRCDRCLKQTEQDFDEQFLQSYSVQSEIIDIMLLVRQTLALTEDIQFLCKPDCLGLCSRCGKDLNEGPCNCRPETLSPFSALKGKFK